VTEIAAIGFGLATWAPGGPGQDPRLFEPTHEVRFPKRGEYFVTPDGFIVRADRDRTSYAAPIFRRGGTQ